MNVVIGIDPHKASHTAVAIDEAEDEISSVKVRATRRQVEQLVRPFEKRRWAIESAGGMGYLLAQQLVARGEDVLDVPATLASRIRVLATGRSNKNDPNDAPLDALSAEELLEVARAFPDQWAYLMARLKFRPDQHVPFEMMDLALELELRYPHALDYYRQRAEDARWRRLDLEWSAWELTERLAASVPFSAGVRA
jgi:hypothetical protein